MVKFWNDGKLMDFAGLIPKDKAEVVKAMEQYVSRGYNIFNIHGRSLNPSGCYAEAVGTVKGVLGVRMRLFKGYRCLRFLSRDGLGCCTAAINAVRTHFWSRH